MAVHAWSVVCDRVVVDQASKEISLMFLREGVLIRPTTERPISTIPVSFLVVSLWIRNEIDTPEKASTRVAVLSPNGKVIGRPIETEVDLTKGTALRSQVAFKGMPMVGAGFYWFHIQQKTGRGRWSTVAKLPFEVTMFPDQPTIGSIEPSRLSPPSRSAASS
jgi:hypothetical protein